MPDSLINIAIDGPAGAGKSTVARLAASKLHMIYIDTGAMYRAVTWKVLSTGLAAHQIEEIAQLAETTEIALEPSEDGQKVFVDGVEVTEQIREPYISQKVSHIAKIPSVRNRLTSLQKQMAIHKGVIMDGRDIGTHVLPDAELKIYLTASVEARAKRRYEELKAKSHEVPYEQIVKEIAERDHTDETREVSPLRQAEDAVVLDTTGLPIEAVVHRIIALAESRMTSAQG
ncbi:(d)CMP kinase [Marinicrinis lubricantis]|uniref:Cytidylate kinase n=1 Tax=Marinicrinis lubricantis TaxID=2086470 RepID=A0ABW1ISQ6_9BACL